MTKSDIYIAYYLYHFLYMYADQCVSVTDLRRQTNKYIGNNQSEQFIFVGSKPTNVLMSMQRYEELKKLEENLYEQELNLHFVPYDSLNHSEKEEFDRAIKKSNSSLIDF